MKIEIFAISLATSLTTVALSGLLASFLEWPDVGPIALIWGVLWFFVAWFVPLGVMIAAVSTFLFPRVLGWPMPLRFTAGLGAGLILGFVWTFLITWVWTLVITWRLSLFGAPLLPAVSLAAWWNEMRLPALSWMSGSASGLAGGLVLGPSSSVRFRIITIAGLLGLAATGVVAVHIW